MNLNRLEQSSVKELKEYASSKNIYISSKLKKSEIIEEIEKF